MILESRNLIASKMSDILHIEKIIWHWINQKESRGTTAISFYRLLDHSSQQVASTKNGA